MVDELRRLVVYEAIETQFLPPCLLSIFGDWRVSSDTCEGSATSAIIARTQFWTNVDTWLEIPRHLSRGKDIWARLARLKAHNFLGVTVGLELIAITAIAG